MPQDHFFTPRSDHDELRLAAIDWLRERTFDGELPLSREEILDFRFRGEKFRLQDLSKGIRKPAGWGAALSVTTSFKPKKAFEIYNDSVGPDGLWRYSWEQGGAHLPTNAGLLSAYELQLPLIGFVGVGGKPPLYQVVAPIRVLAWEPSDEQVVLAPVELGATLGEKLENASLIENIFREYLVRETKVRLHQPFFRQIVLRAYEGRCAVCNLGYRELLDAAHIVPDADGGEPHVTNGLALCKIHHTAYDRRLIGIDVDYVVHVKQSLLDDKDGPMLEHGLKGMHGLRLMALPSHRKEQPSRAALGTAFDRFLQTS